MKVDHLHPSPNMRVPFAWSYHVTIPERPGCYALVAYSGEVLYVGLATRSIRSRMGTHLDTPEKCNAGSQGAPYWFYYVLCNASEVGQIERGWMNGAILEDGTMPSLNKVYSPL